MAPSNADSFDVHMNYLGSNLSSYDSEAEKYIRENHQCALLILDILSNHSVCTNDNVRVELNQRLIEEHGWDASVFQIPSTHRSRRTSAFAEATNALLTQLKLNGYVDNSPVGSYQILPMGTDALATGKVKIEGIDLGGRIDDLLKNNKEASFDDVVRMYSDKYGFIPGDSLRRSIKGAYDRRRSKKMIIEEENKDQTDSTGADAGTFKSGSDQVRHVGTNLLISGVPGSGKSFFVDHVLKKAFCVDDDNLVRTVFHPEYSNSDFVGQLKPGKDISGNLTYEFASGPFTKALEIAYRDPSTPVMLVIEELNRGDCAAIFGEIFQLLDRNDSGESEYHIFLPLVSKHLGYEEGHPVKIPGNLYLVATMNASDQNVFPLDTAFNRRWTFIRYPNQEPAEGDSLWKMCVPGYNKTWVEFVRKINEVITTSANQVQNCEDKQLGYHFVSKDMLVSELDNKDLVSVSLGGLCDGDPEVVLKVLKSPSQMFAYKVLGYLWNDVSRFHRDIFFNDNKYSTLEKVVNAFIGRKDDLFNLSLQMTPVNAGGAVSDGDKAEEEPVSDVKESE